MSEYDEPAEETEDDEGGWQIGDPPEEGREGDEQDSGFEQRGGQAG